MSREGSMQQPSKKQETPEEEQARLTYINPEDVKAVNAEKGPEQKEGIKEWLQKKFKTALFTVGVLAATMSGLKSEAVAKGQGQGFPQAPSQKIETRVAVERNIIEASDEVINEISSWGFTVDGMDGDVVNKKGKPILVLGGIHRENKETQKREEIAIEASGVTQIFHIVDAQSKKEALGKLKEAAEILKDAGKKQEITLTPLADGSFLLINVEKHRLDTGDETKITVAVLKPVSVLKPSGNKEQELDLSIHRTVTDRVAPGQETK